MRKYDILFCDADNTLFDFTASERAAIRASFADAGVPLSDEQIAVYSHINDLVWLAFERGETTREKLHYDRFIRFCEIVGSGSMTPQQIADVYSDKLGKMSVLFPGALDFMKKVSSVMPLCIVSNGFASVQRDKLVSVTEYLSGAYISEEMGVTKPDPRMITIPMAEHGITNPRRVLMMGDSLTADIAAANNAGVDSLLFLYGREEPEKHPATYFAADFDAALRIVEGEEDK